MKRILVTGISGTGKSTVVGALAARDYKAVDLDGDEYSEWVEPEGDGDDAGSTVEVGHDWVWRADRVRTLLLTEDAEVLFVSGCAANMRQFVPRFDRVVLLSAPAEVVVERLATRTTNAYGKRPEEVARVLGQMETVVPLLRRIAGHEIDSSAPLDAVVEELLRVAGELA